MTCCDCCSNDSQCGFQPKPYCEENCIKACEEDWCCKKTKDRVGDESHSRITQRHAATRDGLDSDPVSDHHHDLLHLSGSDEEEGHSHGSKAGGSMGLDIL